MKNILILILAISLSFSNTALTEEKTEAEVTAVESDEKLKQTDGVAEVETEKEPEKTEELSVLPNSSETMEINKSLEVQKINLPACDDENLLELAKDYITSYFKASHNEGTLYRRYKHFILHNINQFKEDNVANYKTPKTRPVSDVIADIEVNQGITDENIRLCKNQSKNNYAGKMYMIIYPKEINVFQIRLVNLTPKQRENEIIGFVYTNERTN